MNTPVKKNPYTSSVLFGLFFGAIVLPCNPAPLTVLFAVSTSAAGFLVNLLNFIMFGVGMATPLIVFALISFKKSNEVIGWIADKKAIINRIVGVIMLAISMYYLFIVFQVQKIFLG